MTKYYTHVRGFADKTAYLVVENGETKTVLKDGSSSPSSGCYPEALCDSYVRQGAWKTITAAQAKSLLGKPPITFILDTRAENVLLNEIELNKRDLKVVEVKEEVIALEMTERQAKILYYFMGHVKSEDLARKMPKSLKLDENMFSDDPDAISFHIYEALSKHFNTGYSD